MRHLSPLQTKPVIEAGGIIAYPTEAVYGLGCDPKNEAAIQRLLRMKRRPWQKGLILIASNVAQLEPYVDFNALSEEQILAVKSKWPGPYTFIMPINSDVSKLLSGEFSSIAVRVSSHQTVVELCNVVGGALVSTSANTTGATPAMTVSDFEVELREHIDAVVTGELGLQQQPSTIIDALSGQVLRA